GADGTGGRSRDGSRRAAHRRATGGADPRGPLHPPDRTVPPMTSATGVEPRAGRAEPDGDAGARRFGPWSTGLAILRRDMYVTGREFPIFLAQVILQPLFLLFVFGKVLTQLGYARPGY